MGDAAAHDRDRGHGRGLVQGGDAYVMESLLLRPSEVSVRLGLSRSKVYRMIECGELPSLRMGRAVRVPRKAFEEWLSRVEREYAEFEPRVLDGGLR